MDKLLNASNPPLNEMSPLSMAFLGDGVFELLVREYLISFGSKPVKKLHSEAVEWVRCDRQAYFLHSLLWDKLSEEEKAEAIRGRNAHVGHVPKNASVEDYHGATALETLFGWLYIKGDIDRIRELFYVLIDERNANEG